jgi:hypothetical protein
MLHIQYVPDVVRDDVVDELAPLELACHYTHLYREGERDCSSTGLGLLRIRVMQCSIAVV